MKLVGYIRVSTEEQGVSGLSLEAQITKLQRYCGVYDHHLGDLYEDVISSGKPLIDRPGWGCVRRALVNGADGVIITKLDRAFRNAREALTTLDELTAAGKHLVIIDEQIDTTSAIGRFFFTITAAFAELERRLISDRTKAALQAKKARGEHLGRHDCIPQSTIERAWFLKQFGWDGATYTDDKPSPPQPSWRSVTKKIREEGLGDYHAGSLYRAVARTKKKEHL